MLNGILEMSASPINYIEGRLIIFKECTICKSKLDEIYKTYKASDFTCASNTNIESEVNCIWECDFLNTIDVYNVGHGNADYIRGEKHRILYDVGYNYRSFPTHKNCKYLRAVNAIRYLKPSCVILSHWDLDHIIGCAYAEREIFTCKWIAPNLTSSRDYKPSINAVRIAKYLDLLGNLKLIDREQNNKLIATIKCSEDIEIKLWLGSGNDKVTPRNIEGLVIEILDNDGIYPHVLLTGDVPYNCIGKAFEEPIDFLHVPHHCSKMELGILKSIKTKGKCAIISTNRTKKTLNCDKEHYEELKRKFEEVSCTIESKYGDEANLSIQIDYSKNLCKFR